MGEILNPFPPPVTLYKIDCVTFIVYIHCFDYLFMFVDFISTFLFKKEIIITCGWINNSGSVIVCNLSAVLFSVVMYLCFCFLFVCVCLFFACVWICSSHSDKQLDCLHQFIFCAVNAFQFAIQISVPAACILWQGRGCIIYNLPGRVSKTGCDNQKHSFFQNLALSRYALSSGAPGESRL